MQAVLHWLTSLPTAALYVALAVVAAIENVFPPIPADTVVALGSFLAAQGRGTLAGAFLSTWIGNVAGAAAMYFVGRRYGAARLEQRMMGEKAAGAEARLRGLYGRFGILALFLSRFVPGVRAIVPPFAGALRIPVLRAILPMALASGLWYGLVSWLGFRVGSNWEALLALLKRYGQYAAIGGAVLLAVVGLVWWLRTRRRT